MLVLLLNVEKGSSFKCLLECLSEIDLFLLLSRSGF